MGSDLIAAAGAIRSHFKSAWKTARGYSENEFTARVAWGGTHFDPPDSDWSRLSFLWGDGFEHTMGGPDRGKNELIGVVTVQLFVPPGEGTGQLEVYADGVRNIFNRQVVSGVRFGAPSGPRAASQREGWLQVDIDIPFTVEETI